MAHRRRRPQPHPAADTIAGCASRSWARAACRRATAASRRSPRSSAHGSSRAATTVTVYGRSHVDPGRAARAPRACACGCCRRSGTSISTRSPTPALSVVDGLLRRFDVVLICNNANAPFALVPRLGGAKVVLNVDGLEWQRGKWSRLGSLVLPGLCLARARSCRSSLVSDARVIARWYRQRFGKPTVYIPYGSDARRLPPGETLARLGLEAGRLPPVRQPARAREPCPHRHRGLPRRGRAGGPRRAARGRRRRALRDRRTRRRLEAAAAATPGVS